MDVPLVVPVVLLVNETLSVPLSTIVDHYFVLSANSFAMTRYDETTGGGGGAINALL